MKIKLLLLFTVNCFLINAQTIEFPSVDFPLGKIVFNVTIEERNVDILKRKINNPFTDFPNVEIYMGGDKTHDFYGYFYDQKLVGIKIWMIEHDASYSSVIDDLEKNATWQNYIKKSNGNKIYYFKTDLYKVKYEYGRQGDYTSFIFLNTIDDLNYEIFAKMFTE